MKTIPLDELECIEIRMALRTRIQNTIRFWSLHRRTNPARAQAALADAKVLGQLHRRFA